MANHSKTPPPPANQHHCQMCQPTLATQNPSPPHLHSENKPATSHQSNAHQQLLLIFPQPHHSANTTLHSIFFFFFWKCKKEFQNSNSIALTHPMSQCPTTAKPTSPPAYACYLNLSPPTSTSQNKPATTSTITVEAYEVYKRIKLESKAILSCRWWVVQGFWFVGATVIILVGLKSKLRP